MQKFWMAKPFLLQFNADHSGRGGGGDAIIRSTVAPLKTESIMGTRAIEPKALTGSEIRAIAAILNKRWAKMEPDASVEKYVKELEWIRANGTTPVWVAEIDGVIGAALIAQRVDAMPSKYSQLIGVDEPGGKIMTCRRITTDPDDTRFAKAPRVLITGYALSYAKGLYDKGELTELIAYSRFSNYKEFLEAHPKTTPGIYLATTYRNDWRTEQVREMMTAYPTWLMNRWGEQSNLGLFLKETKRRHVDDVIGMHLSFGATAHKIMPGACPGDTHAMGYGMQMDYTHFLTGNTPEDAAFREIGERH
ncbi:MAG: hypothetical protein QW568_00700 [Candidatus Anstonellaceae archaeon]